MFERIFNKLYGITGSYSLSLAGGKLLDALQQLMFQFRLQRIDPRTRVTLTETESMELLQSLRPYDPEDLKPALTDRVAADPSIWVSVIVPAYNAADYLEECLQSLLSQQTTYGYEVIVVNDGSTDATGEMLAARKPDDRLVIITQPNGGISRARNRAMSVARGRYFLFVDADDALTPGALEHMLTEAERTRADLVEGNYLLLEKGRTRLGRPLHHHRKQVDFKQTPETMLTIPGYPWGKLYARHLWDDLGFTLGLIYEDTINRLVVLRRARHYVYLPDPLYVYRLHEASLTHQSNSTPKSLDTYYIIDRLIGENHRLKMPLDHTFYRLILKQLGSIFYRRTSGFETNVREALLVVAKKTLQELEGCRPVDLSQREKLLIKSIEELNLPLWELCCRHDE
ncbi:glycosyltransferase family 2 protein [Anoxynatronum buryatiense]|uniref:Glycosyltransferase involved in cell wall bisynthesis n=1 Tax=Anoxynatronum buryatiense TaxID=489973 RepID=A0AA45WW25_9CLOT|nr:glycosyltransferase family 2 protein [Anoxynatronum buryatiense]SMP54908.1 Glycosyltransferase involved in cell wall bisynthesis [Anoxynatronum buryatiense]